MSSMSNINVESIMTVKPVVVSPDQPVSSAAATMNELGVRHLPVTDGETLLGILSSKDLIKPGSSVSEIMTADPASASPTDDVTHAAATMAAMKVSCLPVLQDEKLVGIVTSFDLLKALKNELASHSRPDEEPVTLQAILTPDPIVISPETSVQEAASLMADNEFRHLPVVADNQVVGVISTQDIRPGELKVADVMAKNPTTATPDTTVELAASTLTFKKVSCLLVMTDGALQGIVTTYDLFDALIQRVSRPE